MPNEKRTRKREGREARLAAIAAAQRQAKRRRQIVAAVVVLGLILLVAFVVNGGDSKAKKVEAGAGTSTTVAPNGATTFAPPTTVAGARDPACPPADGSAARSVAFAAPPVMCIDPAKAYSAEVRTTKGTFTIALDAKAAPKTANNFVFLARYHYFDGVVFHRVIPGFVIQGGDPEGTGMGGPGYKFDDELPAAGAYKLGSVVMANSGADTNGSQFFVITGQQGVELPPQYSLFGQVTSGMEVVKAIEALGSPDGKPTEVVTMQTVTIKES